MKVDLIQATTAHYYHAIPSELERVTISPEKTAIFEYLSRIDSDRFVDFIADVLVHVEGHTFVDKTDGPGDEKQDILTIHPDGHRHLTQSKHTARYGENSSGDELDLLVAACLRKDCRSALYVTNADLTVQAKRYVTDHEYLRGWPANASFTPSIDYWNGERIWQRIAGNETILNKWFGGMAQSHGLRAFFCDLVVLKMPQGESPRPELAALAQRLNGVPAADPNSLLGEVGFFVEINDELKVRISESIATPADLRIPFGDPRSAALPLDSPFWALRVHASVMTAVGVYDPTRYRDRIVKLIGNALPDLAPGEWWYIAAGPPQAFVFLQDIAKPVLVPIGEAGTFVRIGNGPVTPEIEWALVPGPDFVPGNPEDEDEMVWRQRTSNATVHVLVEQGLPFWRVADLYLRQRQIREKLAKLKFRAIAHASGPTVAQVRNLCHPDWPILQSHPDGTVFWAYPESEENEADEMAAVLERQGATVLFVDDEDRERIVAGVEASPTEAEMVTSSKADLLTPIKLPQRVLWLESRIQLSDAIGREQFIGLMRFKVNYEARHGYDFLHGADTGQIAAEEIRRILCDLLSFRGSRMLDLCLGEDELLIHLRFRVDGPESATEAYENCAREMESIKRDLKGLLSRSPRPTQ